MIEGLEARLQAVDPAILADVVRQDQRSPAFEIADWSFKHLSDEGTAQPDNLWLFSGSGHSGDGPRPWSVVLKLCERPQQEPAPDSRHYWKREPLMAQSGLLERLPGRVRAPRCYRTDEHPDNANPHGTVVEQAAAWPRWPPWPCTVAPHCRMR